MLANLSPVGQRNLACGLRRAQQVDWAPCEYDRGDGKEPTRVLARPAKAPLPLWPQLLIACLPTKCFEFVLSAAALLSPRAQWRHALLAEILAKCTFTLAAGVARYLHYTQVRTDVLSTSAAVCSFDFEAGADGALAPLSADKNYHLLGLHEPSAYDRALLLSDGVIHSTELRALQVSTRHCRRSPHKPPAARQRTRRASSPKRGKATRSRSPKKGKATRSGGPDEDSDCWTPSADSQES